MKKSRLMCWFAAMLGAILLFSAVFAEGSEDFGEDNGFAVSSVMQVINCENWVSLREEPDTHADRLAKVPLSALVENCRAAENGFIQCSYCGMEGYILGGYLDAYIGEVTLYGADAMTIGELIGDGEPLMNWKNGDYQTAASIRRVNGRELLYTGCCTVEGEPVWSRSFLGEEGSQFRSVDCFIGGEMGDPYLLVYTPGGLTAVNILSGKDLWTLDSGTERLGSGIIHLVDPTGNIYITGYDGPPPVCIDKNGQVRWTSEIFNSEIYWPYAMNTREDGLHVLYESPCETDPDGHYDVCFNLETGMMEYYDIVRGEVLGGSAEIVSNRRD